MSNWRRLASYKHWRNDCILREEGRCQITGVKTNLHVHHIKHSTYWPELRTTISNGFVMHRSVHYLFHYFMMGGTKKKCDDKDLKRFIRLFKFVTRVAKLINGETK